MFLFFVRQQFPENVKPDQRDEANVEEETAVLESKQRNYKTKRTRKKENTMRQ